MSLTEKIYNPSQLRHFLENGETDQILYIIFNRTSLMAVYTNPKLNAGVPGLVLCFISTVSLFVCSFLFTTNLSLYTDICFQE